MQREGVTIAAAHHDGANDGIVAGQQDGILTLVPLQVSRGQKVQFAQGDPIRGISNNLGQLLLPQRDRSDRVCLSTGQGPALFTALRLRPLFESGAPATILLRYAVLMLCPKSHR